MYYQAVRPKVLLYALNWLVANNELYKTITIDIDKLDRNLTNLQNTSEISEGTINTTAQPVSDQNIIRDENITEQINEPENEELLLHHYFSSSLSCILHCLEMVLK